MAKNSIGRDIGKIMKSMDKVSSDTEKVMDILEGMNRNSELGYDGQDALRIIKLLYMTIDEFHHELSFVAKDLKFSEGIL